MSNIIAVDYDGTIVDWAYPRSGTVKTGAKEALQKFKDLGYFILIWSCRTCNWFPESFPGHGTTREELIADMRRTLESNGIPFDEIDDGSRGKPMAAFYIDDHAIGFNENWSQISDYVSSLTL